MTDPNIPPRNDEANGRPTYNTTITTPPERRGGGIMAFIIGGLVVAVVVIAYLVYSGRAPTPDAPDADIDVSIEAPALPDIPTPDMPEAPAPAAPPAAE